jgi:hypothetical protein
VARWRSWIGAAAALSAGWSPAAPSPAAGQAFSRFKPAEKKQNKKEEITMVYMSNAFSLNMLKDFPVTVHIRKADIETVKGILSGGFVSGVGHTDTANIISGMLNMKVEANRITININADDILVVAQYIGPRLPEGATQLPEGAKIEWFIVTVK